MQINRKIFVLSIFLLFLSLVCVCAADNQQDIYDINYILENYNESDLTGCCSVLLQLDGNDSIMSFRRDANLTADIYIEQIDWHGHQAIKQYKTEGDYFCQVIITEEGWMLGFGGIDDGEDNKRIEEISSKMITDDNSISEDALAEIEDIKKAYKLGHFVIKAPNGNYGIATATSHYTSKLAPGEYISVPNREKYFSSGNVELNSTDKITQMVELAASDVFGITRRDITTFDYHHVENSSYNGSVVDLYLSNDDGSMFGMDSGWRVDNVYFNDYLFKAEDIPIAPNYEDIGTVVFPGTANSPVSKLLLLSSLVAFVFIVALLFYLVLKFIRIIKFKILR